MSANIPKYAQNFAEFKDTVEFYTRRVALTRTRINKIAVVSQMYNYLCNNAQFVYLHEKLARTTENTLIRFWKEDLWLGAYIYLQRLFPMSARLSGQRVLPKPL